MSWSYRKRIKVIPGVHLNIGKNGISTSIGVRGASLNFGRNKNHLNVTIPGSNISNSQNLFNPTPISRPSLDVDMPEIYIEDKIFSREIHEITSQNLKGIKEAILTAIDQRKDLRKDLLKIKKSLMASKFKLITSYVFAYGFIKKSISQSIKEDISSKTNAIKQLEQQIKECYVNLDIEFDEDIRLKYDKVVKTFTNLITCNKIWDVTSAHSQDRVATRSAANTIVRKKEVKFAFKSTEYIKSVHQPLFFKNANGADLYFYPSLIIMVSETNFAIIGMNEIEFNHNYVRFVETGTVPNDTKIIDKTWAKVNKNGSPDKRFKGNYQIPVVKYGDITLKTKTGVHEEYEFSNFEYTEEFGKAFKDYQNIFRTTP